MENYPADRYAADLQVMIEADRQHMASELAAGNRVNAHRHLDAVIDNRRELEDVRRKASGK